MSWFRVVKKRGPIKVRNVPKKKYTALPQSPKKRARARKLKYSSRDAGRAFLAETAQERERQEKDLKSLQDAVDNAPTEKDRSTAQLALDQYKEREFSSGTDKPLRGTEKEIGNTKRIQELNDQIAIKEGQMYNTQQGSAKYKELQNDIKQLKNDRGKIEQRKNPDGSPAQAQEYVSDKSPLQPQPQPQPVPQPKMQVQVQQKPPAQQSPPTKVATQQASSGNQPTTQVAPPVKTQQPPVKTQQPEQEFHMGLPVFSGNEYGDITFDPFGMHTGFNDPTYKRKSWTEIVRR